jgi:hypothetical protein
MLLAVIACRVDRDIRDIAFRLGSENQPALPPTCIITTVLTRVKPHALPDSTHLARLMIMSAQDARGLEDED